MQSGIHGSSAGSAPNEEQSRSPDCIAIMGATATGKSYQAIRLAKKLDSEIISMDSRQVYRGMDIGTAKASREDREIIPHHLIDILDPSEFNSAGRHAESAAAKIAEIKGKNKIPLLVGGTGLYFRALFYGLADMEVCEDTLKALRAEMSKKSTSELYEELELHDARRAKELSPNDRLRITRALEVFMSTGKPISNHFARRNDIPRLSALKIVLTIPRWQLREQIARRSREMFASGWIEEVKELLQAGFTSESPGMISIGYREIAKALEEGRDAADQLENIITLTRQYAKRQETFFRSEKGAVWLDVTAKGFEQVVDRLVSRYFHLKNNLT